MSRCSPRRGHLASNSCFSEASNDYSKKQEVLSSSIYRENSGKALNRLLKDREVAELAFEFQHISLCDAELPRTLHWLLKLCLRVVHVT